MVQTNNLPRFSVWQGQRGRTEEVQPTEGQQHPRDGGHEQEDQGEQVGAEEVHEEHQESQPQRELCAAVRQTGGGPQDICLE